MPLRIENTQTASLDVDPDLVPVVTRDEVTYAKPDPDRFLAAAERLGAPIETAIVVGDSIWEMLAAARCRSLGVGLLSGGYGSEELRQSGVPSENLIRWIRSRKENRLMIETDGDLLQTFARIYVGLLSFAGTIESRNSHCAYRKPKPGRSGDEVRQGLRVT